MAKLKMLGKPYLNEYNTTECFVHLGYGDESTPKDHLENPLGMDASDFEQHLRDVIFPQINKLLAKSSYKLSDTIDYPNTSILAALTIKARDGKNLNVPELKDIERLMTNILNDINKKASNANSLSGAGSSAMFATSAAAAASVDSDIKSGNRVRGRR